MKPVAEMTEQEKAQIRAWVKRWEEIGPVPEAERAGQIRSTDTRRAMELLDDAFTSAVWLNPPRPGSGLVEQQEIFSRARR